MHVCSEQQPMAATEEMIVGGMSGAQSPASKRMAQRTSWWWTAPCHRSFGPRCTKLTSTSSSPPPPQLHKKPSMSSVRLLPHTASRAHHIDPIGLPELLPIPVSRPGYCGGSCLAASCVWFPTLHCGYIHLPVTVACGFLPRTVVAVLDACCAQSLL